MSNFYGASDLDVMFAEFGVPVEFTVSGVVYQGKGIEDTVDEDLVKASGISLAGKRRTVLVKTGDFPGLIEGVFLSVDGTAMRVVTARQVDDGAMTRVFCASL